MKSLALITALLFGAAMANASDFTFKSVGLGDAVHLSGRLNADVFAGQLNFDSKDLGKQTTYCVGIDDFISPGQTYGVSLTRSDTQSDLGLRMAGNIIANGSASVDTNDKAAGLQLAVWEALYDGGAKADFTSGQVRASTNAAVIAYADQYYATRNNGAMAHFYKTTCNVGQSQMNACPEPASIASLVVGALGILRRKAKK